MTDKKLVEDFATDWDHTDPQWVNDPFPIWEDLRGRCPVAHTDRYGGGGSQLHTKVCQRSLRTPTTSLVAP